MPVRRGLLGLKKCQVRHRTLGNGNPSAAPGHEQKFACPSQCSHFRYSRAGSGVQNSLLGKRGNSLKPNKPTAVSTILIPNARKRQVNASRVNIDTCPFRGAMYQDSSTFCGVGYGCSNV
jgi:hypothetical protein